LAAGIEGNRQPGTPPGFPAINLPWGPKGDGMKLSTYDRVQMLHWNPEHQADHRNSFYNPETGNSIFDPEKRERYYNRWGLTDGVDIEDLVASQSRMEIEDGPPLFVEEGVVIGMCLCGSTNNGFIAFGELGRGIIEEGQNPLALPLRRSAASALGSLPTVAPSSGRAETIIAGAFRVSLTK
jgi:hypothetical protein